MNNNNRDRGFASEAMVKRALTILKRKKKPDIAEITEIIHATPNSNLDRKGIDFVVKLENGYDVPLQVKSSKRAQKKFDKRCRRTGVWIPVIVVNIGVTIGNVIRQIIRSIKTVLNTARHAMDERIHREKEKASRKQKKKDWCVRHFAPSMCH
ncbi:MAG: hypothetical protein WCS89_00990 [Candidatus Paceibacterota bacterium]|jgi:hypothetical protein